MSPSPFGPWLKIPAQAEPGGEWFKDLSGLECQQGRTFPLNEVCLFSALRLSSRDSRSAATLLNRACLSLVAPTWQVRPWTRTTQRACVTGACYNWALHLSILVGTLQYPSIIGC
eukprot:5824746-Amphidinium_carterae.1